MENNFSVYFEFYALCVYLVHVLETMRKNSKKKLQSIIFQAFSIIIYCNPSNFLL